MDLSNLARTRQLLNDLTGESASVFRPITILTISFKISEVPYSKDLNILIVNNIAECSKKTSCIQMQELVLKTKKRMKNSS